MDAYHSRPQETAFGRAMQEFGIFACILEHGVDIRTLSHLQRIYPTVQAVLQSWPSLWIQGLPLEIQLFATAILAFSDQRPMDAAQRAAFLSRYLDNSDCPIPKLTYPRVTFAHLEIVYYAIETLSLSFAKTCMDRIEFSECQMRKGMAHLTREQGFKISRYLDSWRYTGKEINQERDESRSEVEESEGERVRRMALNAERRRRTLARTPYPWK